MRPQMIRFSLPMLLALSAGSALAADDARDPHHPGTPPAAAAMPGMSMGSMSGMSGNMPMPGMMQMMMGENGMASHVEGRIAFLRTELKITDAQQPLWNAVADVMRANAKNMAGMPHGMVMMGESGTLPEKLAAHEKMLAAHLDGLRKIEAAVEPLYGALNADQKKTADELMIGPMGMGMM